MSVLICFYRAEVVCIICLQFLCSSGSSLQGLQPENLDLQFVDRFVH